MDLIFNKPLFPISLKNFLVLAVKKKADPEPEDDEDEDDEPEPKKKPQPKGEETPAWAKELISLLKPKEPSKKETEIPVPKKPAKKEEEEDHQEPPKTETKKRSFWDWLM